MLKDLLKAEIFSGQLTGAITSAIQFGFITGTPHLTGGQLSHCFSEKIPQLGPLAISSISGSCCLLLPCQDRYLVSIQCATASVVNSLLPSLTKRWSLICLQHLRCRCITPTELQDNLLALQPVFELYCRHNSCSPCSFE